MHLRPQVIELLDGPVTVFPDVRALQAGALIEDGWLGSPDEPLELAHMRQRIEAAQRAETEETYPHCQCRHFEGGTLVIGPSEGGASRVSVLLYGLGIEDGEWRSLSSLAHGPKDSPTRE